MGARGGLGLPALRARRVSLTARTVAADRALAWELVDAVVPGAELAGFAVNYAARIAANAPLSLRGNKRVLRTLETAAGAHDDHAVREPIELRDACFASRNFAEGVRAFAGKREPRWTGE